MTDDMNREIYERLAKIEEKIDSLGLRFGERLATVEARLEEIIVVVVHDA
ncbi:MAG: hypothetical protein LBB60_01675 [Desulfovibrio sp.]|nr:hypothetical protein [Desulfovibrio sp.]